MTFNYALLRGKIKDDYGTFAKFAKAIGITESRMSMLLNNKARWDTEMIVRAARLLNIEESIPTYFFTVKSHK